MQYPEMALKRAYSRAVTLWRDHSPAGRAVARSRTEVERQLDGIARSTPHCFTGTVLVDGMWDNPNYWLRYSLLRTALGLAHGREIGITGEYRRRHCRATCVTFGAGRVEACGDFPVRDV